MKEARLEKQLIANAWRAYRVATALGATLFLAGVVLDALTQPQALTQLLAIRISTAIGYAFLYAFARKEKYPFKSSFLSGLFVLSLASASITAMCLVLDGYESPYYAGINLVMLAAGMLFPWSGRQMTAAAACIVGIYVLAVLAKAGFAIDRLDVLVNNLYFLGCTAVISVSAGWLGNRLRRESYLRLYSIEEAHEALQSALETQQGDIRSASLEIVRALRLRDEFLSVASHELKTPLTALLLQSQMSKRALEKDAQGAQKHPAYAKFLDSVARQVARLSRLIEDMLDVSRIQTGNLSMRPERFDLVELAQEICERFRPQAETVGSILQVHSSSGAAVGTWDRHRLEQVITNLITNAIKYGGGKPIELQIETRDARALIEVRDQGIGIPPEHQARIFERYERAVSPENIGGLGLGLYITRQIVVAHGGEVNVESQLGQGSVFKVSLPVG